jgi:Transposase DDE domain
VIDHTTALYCITADLLKAAGHKDDVRSQLTDAEVITTAIVAALYFGGNIERSRSFMRSTGLMPRMLSRSRLTRRLHDVAELVNTLFHRLGLVLKEAAPSTRYLLDSFPVALCDNMRIGRCRLVRDEEFRGYIASKRRYFYGVRVQVVTTEDGVPVELAFLPGSASDVRGLGVLPLALPSGSELFMDSGYTDYGAEDAAAITDGVEFAPSRKSNSKRSDDVWRSYYKQLMRKRIETVFSQMTNLFPKHIHAVTLDGFLLKVSMFVIAFALDKAFI